MLDIGSLELLVVGILGLLILGPERLPKAAHTVGLIIGRIRNSVTNFQQDLERHVRTEELKAKLRDPSSTFLDEEASESIATDQQDSHQAKAEQNTNEQNTKETN